MEEDINMANNVHAGDATHAELGLSNVDRMRFRSMTYEVIEELRMRRDLDRENERKIQTLLQERFDMGHRLDVEVSRLSSVEEKHDMEVRELRRQLDDKLREFQIDALQQQVFRKIAEKENEALKDEIQKLQLDNYVLEKRVREAERHEKVQATEREQHIGQVAQFERQFNQLATTTRQITAKQNKLDSDMATVRGLNHKLMYENRHHACVLEMKDADICRLQRDVLAAHITTKTEPGSTADREQALHGEITLLQKNVDELKDEQTEMTEDRNTWREKYWTMLTSLDEAHRLISVNLHNAARFKEECRQAEEGRDLTAERLDTAQRQLKDVNKLLDDHKHGHQRDLEKWEAVKSTLEASIETIKLELGCETRQKDELQEKVTAADGDIEILKAEIEDLQAVLNKEKTDCAAQTDLCLLCMVSQGIQAATDLTAQETQTTPPELVLRAVQTINAATCSTSAQTDIPHQPDTAECHSQTTGVEMCSTATQTGMEQRKVVMEDGSISTDGIHPHKLTVQPPGTAIPQTADKSHITSETGNSNTNDEIEFIAIPIDSSKHRPVEMKTNFDQQMHVLPPSINRQESQHQVMNGSRDGITTSITNMGERKHFKFTAAERSHSDKQLNQNLLDINVASVRTAVNDNLIKPSKEVGLCVELMDQDLNKDGSTTNDQILTDKPCSTVNEAVLKNDTSIRSNVGISVKSLRLNKKSYLTRPVDIDPNEYSITLSQAQKELCSDVGNRDIADAGKGDGNMANIDETVPNNEETDKAQELCLHHIDNTTNSPDVLQTGVPRNHNGSYVTDDVIGQSDISDDLIGPSQPMSSGLSLSHSQTSGFKHKLLSDYSESAPGLFAPSPQNSDLHKSEEKCTGSKQPKLSAREERHGHLDLSPHMICVPHRVNVPEHHTCTALDTATGVGVTQTSSTACTRSTCDTDTSHRAAVDPNIRPVITTISHTSSASSDTVTVGGTNTGGNGAVSVTFPDSVSKMGVSVGCAAVTSIMSCATTVVPCPPYTCSSGSRSSPAVASEPCATTPSTARHFPAVASEPCATTPSTATVTCTSSGIHSNQSSVDKDSDKSSFLQKYRDMMAKLKPAPTQFQHCSGVQPKPESAKVRPGTTHRRGEKALYTNPTTQCVQEPVPAIVSPRPENPRGILKRQSAREKNKTVSWFQK